MRTFETQDNTAECVGLCMLAAIWFPSCGFCRFYFGFVSISMCVCVRAFFSRHFYIHFIPDENFHARTHNLCTVYVLQFSSFSSPFHYSISLVSFILFDTMHADKQTRHMHVTCDWEYLLLLLLPLFAVAFQIRRKYGANSIKILFDELNFDPFPSISLFPSFTWNSIETLLTN